MINLFFWKKTKRADEKDVIFLPAENSIKTERENQNKETKKAKKRSENFARLLQISGSASAR